MELPGKFLLEETLLDLREIPVYLKFTPNTLA